jgi:uncharacterized membrane protein
MDYLIVKTQHILSSTFLFGTGVGSTFYFLFASRRRDPVVVVAEAVVVADWLFTATTVVLQLLSGAYLVHTAHFSWDAPCLHLLLDDRETELTHNSTL